MKKLLIVSFLMIGLFATLMASGMGYIDVQKVFMSYDYAIEKQEDFAKREKEFKSKVEEKQEELEKFKDNRKKYRDKKAELQDELEAEQEELLALNQKLSVEIKENILASVKKIAREYALDWVVDKQVMLHGGIDVTDWVTEDLNKKK